jgi:hypothetical protein
MQSQIIANAIQNALSYSAYRELVQHLLKEGKSTGPVQSEVLTHYSELNEVRMNRVEKTVSLTEDDKIMLANLSQNQLWVVISEGWCGDAAQILPVINKMAEASSKVDFKVVLRDENEDFMQLFLTNGSKSIPKLIVLNPETLEVLHTWGPRPKGAVDVIEFYKKTEGSVNENAKIALQKWYAKDKGREIIDEVAALALSVTENV